MNDEQGPSKKLRWKRPTPGRQETHDGRYWVVQMAVNPEWQYALGWHVHRSDLDEAIVFQKFTTRWEAKQFCEADYRTNGKAD